MPNIHTYTITGHWSGTGTSVGQLNFSNAQGELSVPENLGGPGVGTSPEEMLLASAAGCYLITLATLLRNRDISYAKIQLESEGFVEDEVGLRYDRIDHRPTIYFEGVVDEDEIVRLANHAEHACMVSSALRGNVAVTVHPTIVSSTIHSTT